MTRSNARFVRVAVAATLSLSVAACSGEPKVAETPYPDGGLDAMAPPPPPPPPPPPDAGAPAAQAGPCDATTSGALASMVQARAAAEAPGAELEGGVACGVAAEGQSVSLPLTLMPGFCYTVLAQALPNVSEVDVQLVLDLSGGQPVPPLLAAFAQQPIAVGSGTGVMDAIGAKQDCYKWPFPIPAITKVVVRPRMGSGPVAAQVYKRKK